MCPIGQWEETAAPGGNLHRQGENMPNSTHKGKDSGRTARELSPGPSCCDQALPTAPPCRPSRKLKVKILKLSNSNFFFLCGMYLDTAKQALPLVRTLGAGQKAFD